MKQPWYIKNVLFKLDSELAHDISFRFLKGLAFIPGLKAILKSRYFLTSEKLERKILGITFPNPIGLAAGFDKNGYLDSFFSSLGFGFCEIGTITLKPQEGYPRPRIFRFPKERALVNRMGFPNRGVEEVIKRLRPGLIDIPRGINLGKNMSTPLEEAPYEYAELVRKTFLLADYFAINVSSPNTPELRSLQNLDFLSKLLDKIDEANKQMAEETGKGCVPVFVKISPDCSDAVLEEMVDVIKSRSLYGMIATNTSPDRSLFSEVMPKEGGMSGHPLSQKSTQVIKKIYQLSQGKLPIIGCGGIFSVENAIQKIDAGASLLQVYTAFIYYGPQFIKALNEGIQNKW